MAHKKKGAAGPSVSSPEWSIVKQNHPINQDYGRPESGIKGQDPRSNFVFPAQAMD